MKKFKKALSLVLALALITSCFSVVLADEGTTPTYEATRESCDQHNTEPEWFQDAKFGIWFHWGPYSAAAYDTEWYGKFMYNYDSTGWGYAYSHHVEKYGDPFTEWPYHYFIEGAYDKAGNWVQFAPKLKSEGGNFDPEEWAQLFTDAGAKIGGVTAEHHDGFSMWDSEVSPWNAADKGPQLDLVGLLTDAYREQGMKVMFSNHYAYNFTGFFGDESASGRGGPGVPPQTDPLLQQLYGQLEHEVHEDLWLAKLKEQIDLYQPDYMWNDFNNKHIAENKRLEYLSYYYNKAEEWGKEVIVSANLNDGFNNDGYYGDSEMRQYERGGPADIAYPYWMSEDSISPQSWSYVENMRYYSAKAQINSLADKVSKNGTLILNIAPMADGTIPQAQQDILRAIGDWLEKNGEAIYATRAWDIYGEGPTKMGGGSFTEPKEGTVEDIRFTRNKANDALYAIDLSWPEDNQMVVTNLREGYIDGSEITAITLVNGGEELAWSQDDEGLKVTLPQDKKDVNGVAIKVQFAEEVPSTFNDPEITVPKSTRASITLPQSAGGCTIKWNSLNDDIMTDSGELLRTPADGEAPFEVIFEATITKDGMTHVQKHTVKIITALENLVLQAEISKAQADIDAAQAALKVVADSEEKAKFMQRIDVVQKKADAVLYVDQAENGLFGAETIGTDPLVGNYAAINCTGRVNPQKTFSQFGAAADSVSLLGTKVKIEQKIKFDSIPEAKYIYLYTNGGQIFGLDPSSGLVMGSQWMTTADANLSPNKWYNVVIEIDGTDYTAGCEKYHTYYIEDVETGEIVAKRTAPVKFANWEGKSADLINSYQFVNDAYGDMGETAKFYLGDVIITEIKPLNVARNAVVKAERSFKTADIEEAQALVDALEDGEDKTAFQTRLDSAKVYEAATTAVVKAEATRLQSDYDVAAAEVVKLPAGTIKVALEIRLAAIVLITPEEAAANLVAAAEASKKQEDIDAAQAVIITLAKTAARTVLEERLDAVQAKVDATVFVDFEKPTSFGTGNASTSSIVSENENDVLQINLTNTNNGGWGQPYSLNGGNAIGNEFTVSQKFKFEGNFVDAGKIIFYAAVNGWTPLFMIGSDGTVSDQSWGNVNPDTSDITSGNWYNIVYKYSNGNYTISVTDVQSGEEVFATAPKSAGWSGTDLKDISYQFNGSTSDETGKIYMDDIMVTPVTALSAARNAVVKAERTGLAADITAATTLVAALDAGSVKNSLTERVGKLSSVNLSFGTVTLTKDAPLTAGDITASVEVTNSGNKDGKAQLIVAIYSVKDGFSKLVSCKVTASETVVPGTPKTLTGTITVPDVSDGDYVLKVFVWDSESGIKPLTGTTVVTE